MIVIVTEDHIIRGRRYSASWCPVALAIREATGKETLVGVSEVFIEDKEPYGTTYKLPEEVNRFTSDFDYSRKVYPLKFKLDLES
ncbi:MAG TPA: hypothetical protein VEP90_19910 [Methylomirabilota bacterium]|nr:hypothetical protein [Methylomirabilota bacterium]